MIISFASAFHWIVHFSFLICSSLNILGRLNPCCKYLLYKYHFQSSVGPFSLFMNMQYWLARSAPLSHPHCLRLPEVECCLATWENGKKALQGLILAKCKHFSLEVACVTIPHSTLATANHISPLSTGARKINQPLSLKGLFIYLTELGILFLSFFYVLFGNPFVLTNINVFSFYLGICLFMYISVCAFLCLCVCVCVPMHTCALVYGGQNSEHRVSPLIVLNLTFETESLTEPVVCPLS